jgi:hypothetical protein
MSAKPVAYDSDDDEEVHVPDSALLDTRTQGEKVTLIFIHTYTTQSTHYHSTINTLSMHQYTINRLSELEFVDLGGKGVETP